VLASARAVLRQLGKPARPAVALSRDEADRNVPIVVYAPGVVAPGTYRPWVETTQVAPTILDLLGLDPNALQAVQIEGTQVLPGTARH
jgi:arylsulfatase A-like enzyme